VYVPDQNPRWLSVFPLYPNLVVSFGCNVSLLPEQFGLFPLREALLLDSLHGFFPGPPPLLGAQPWEDQKIFFFAASACLTCTRSSFFPLCGNANALRGMGHPCFFFPGNLPPPSLGAGPTSFAQARSLPPFFLKEREHPPPPQFPGMEVASCFFLKSVLFDSVPSLLSFLPFLGQGWTPVPRLLPPPTESESPQEFRGLFCQVFFPLPQLRIGSTFSLSFFEQAILECRGPYTFSVG